MAGSISPARVIEQLQEILNDTAIAQNYQLEEKTIKTYSIITRLEQDLPADEGNLSNYYLLFNTWIRWLSDWDNYSLNLLHRRRLLGYLNKQLGQGKFTFQIYPYAGRLYCIRMNGNKPLIQLHESMDYMSDRDCQQFALFIKTKRWNDLKHMLQEYQNRTPQSKKLAVFFHESRTKSSHANQTRGRYYDLESVFNKCNQRNFGGKMSRPNVIFWSQQVNHTTMGSYNLQEDCLMINKGLDRPDVPEYVLDFVMYHELLHKALGIKMVGTRRMAHTKEFRALEQAHPDYLKAEAFIKKNASRL